MRKRLLMLLVILAAVVTATGCCGWAGKHCPRPGVPGPVIRLGLQNGVGTWTLNNGTPLQTGTAANGKLRNDFIGTETMMMKCTRKADGEEVDALHIRLTMNNRCVDVVRTTAPVSPPHWHLQASCGSSTGELLPTLEFAKKEVPLELTQVTKIAIMANGTEVTECSAFTLQVWP